MARDGKTHIFTGKTFVEAVAKAKTKLGKDISVVKRRDVPEKKNLFSLLNGGKLGGDSLSVELEVAVTPPEEKKKEDIQAPAAPNPLLRTYAKALEGAEKHSPAARQAMVAAAEPYLSLGETSTGIDKRLEDLQRAVEKTSRENADMREEVRMLISLQARGGVPAVEPVLLDCYRRLVDHDVKDELARDIVEDLQREHPGLESADEAMALLKDAVARRIPATGPILLRDEGPTVIALVGPSGVGKTTSLVKLAIHYAMRCRKSVGVVNGDLRRPGAEVQINNVGRLVGAVVTSASGLRETVDVVRSLSGKDLVLIDTVGRSPRDAAGIEKLGEILNAAGVHETHLLLSGVNSEKMMEETVARYRPTGFDRIILTKLDECVSFGSVLNVGSRLANGFSYVTTGSDYNLPIGSADSAMLAELVLGMRTVDVESVEGRLETE